MMVSVYSDFKICPNKQDGFFFCISDTFYIDTLKCIHYTLRIIETPYFRYYC